MGDNNNLLVDFNKIPVKLPLNNKIVSRKDKTNVISIPPHIIAEFPKEKFNYFLIIVPNDEAKKK
jgi:hypothetical protein